MCLYLHSILYHKQLTLKNAPWTTENEDEFRVNGDFLLETMA